MIGVSPAFEFFDLEKSAITLEDLECESLMFCKEWVRRLERFGEEPSAEMLDYLKSNPELLEGMCGIIALLSF
jgi:hypothetical protein